MNTTNRLLDRVKEVRGLSSDYAVSKLLSVSRQVISNYRSGRHQMDDATAIRAAVIAGDDPAEMLARIYRERATTVEARETWERLENLAKHAPLLGAVSALRAA